MKTPKLPAEYRAAVREVLIQLCFEGSSLEIMHAVYSASPVGGHGLLKYGLLRRADGRAYRGKTQPPGTKLVLTKAGKKLIMEDM